MILFLLIITFFSLIVITLFLYLHSCESERLDHSALQNLLTEQEKAFYLEEYKKMVTAKIVYDHMGSEDKSAVEVAREVIKSRREK